jgi:hypothetical protein
MEPKTKIACVASGPYYLLYDMEAKRVPTHWDVKFRDPT